MSSNDYPLEWVVAQKEIKTNISTLCNKYENWVKIDPYKEAEKYRNALEEFSLKTELTCLLLRENYFQLCSFLPANSNNQEYREEYLNTTIQNLNIDIKKEKGIYKITLPALLPKNSGRRTDKLFSAALCDLLYHAINNYHANNKIKVINKAVVAYVHHYANASIPFGVRDNDNVEIKNINNVLTNFFVLDDSGNCMDLVNIACKNTSGKNKTQIFIMPQKLFPKWYKRFKNNSNFNSFKE